VFSRFLDQNRLKIEFQVKRQRPSFSSHHSDRILGFLSDTSYVDASDASFFLTSWGGQRIAHPH
jgi:hypothetical protein